MSVVVDLARYAIRPTFHAERRRLDTIAVRQVGVLLAVKLGLSVAFIVVASRVMAQSGVERSELAIRAASAPLPVFFVTAVIAYPLIEELVFRSWLGSRHVAVIVLSSVLAAVALALVPHSPLTALPPRLSAGLVAAAGIAFVAFLVLYAVRLHRSPSFERAFDRLFPVSFHLSATGFAALHVFNFDAGGTPFVLALLVLPQFVSGLIYGYARMRYGMWANVGLHSTNNAVIFLADRVI